MFSRSRNSTISCDASGSQKSKMAAHKQENSYLSLYTTFLHDFKGFIYVFNVFKVQEFNEAILHIVWRKRKSEIQDGGSQKEEILISQPVYNISAQFQQLNTNIQSTARSSVKLFSRLCNAGGNQKSKMAAYTPKYWHLSLYIQRSCKIPTTEHMFSRFKIWRTLFSILCDGSKH